MLFDIDDPRLVTYCATDIRYWEESERGEPSIWSYWEKMLERLGSGEQMLVRPVKFTSQNTLIIIFCPIPQRCDSLKYYFNPSPSYTHGIWM
jgi:hypothetical protein